MEKFLIDMHVHTSEVSACGQVKAEDGVRMYHSAGYQGMMITDHFHKQYFENLNLESWEKKIDRYLEGYHKAKVEGQRLGMEILLGMEFRNYETDNDFLIVGLTGDFLYRHPNLYELPLAKAIDVFHENGMLVIQAHPVRCRIVGIEAGKLYTEYRSEQMLHILEANPEMEEMSYNEGMKMLKNTPVEQWKMPLKLKVCDLMCEDKLDGIEAYNGNCNWVQEPEKVKEILERHPEYIQISASDFHGPEHLARGGIVLDRRVKTSQELKDALVERDKIVYSKGR